MIDFFHHAPYGAIFLVVSGAFGFWTSTSVGVWQRAHLKQTARQKEALRNVFHAKFVTGGMILSGLAWWVIQG